MIHVENCKAAEILKPLRTRRMVFQIKDTRVMPAHFVESLLVVLRDPDHEPM